MSAPDYFVPEKPAQAQGAPAYFVPDTAPGPKAGAQYAGEEFPPLPEVAPEPSSPAGPPDVPSNAPPGVPGWAAHLANLMDPRQALTSAAHGASTLVTPLQPGVAAVNAYVRSMLPGGPKMRDAYAEEMAALNRVRTEAEQKNPGAFLLGGAGAMVGASMLGAPVAPASSFAPTVPGFLPSVQRGVAGTLDAALFNTASAAGAGGDTGAAASSPANLLGAIPGAAGAVRAGAGSAKQGMGDWLAARASAKAEAQAAARVEAEAAARAAGAAGAQGGGAGAQSTAELTVTPGAGIKDLLFVAPEPIPQAQYLLDRGVRLTKGLYDPKSSRAMVEMSSTSQPTAGPGISKQRHQALTDALDLGFTEAKPPGSTVRLSGDINDKYVALKDAWDAAYDAIRAKKELVSPAHIEGEYGVPFKGTPENPGVFDRIIDDTTDPLAAVWDDASREQARRFLNNQLTRLGASAKDAAGRVPLGDMLKMLSDVRKASSAALKGQKYDLNQILSRSASEIEQAVETQASPETAAQLRALNGRYRNFKVMEDAVVRAGDSPAGITPSRLSASVRGADPSRSDYAAGGGGDLRDLSKAIATVFDESASPKTGARLAAIAPEWLKNKVIGPTIYWRNEQAIKAQGGAAGAAAGAGADVGTRAGATTKAGASASTDLTSMLGSRPQAFGKWAPTLQSVAVNKGPAGLAAAHYVLMETQPTYRIGFNAAAAQEKDDEGVGP